MRTVLQVLSPAELDQLHERSLHVLATTGMRVDTALGRSILAEAGAQVDEATRMVRFPPALVEESLRRAPKHFSLGGRRPDWSVKMNEDQFTLLVDGGGTTVVDRHTGERRTGTFQDWREATTIIDSLDDVGLYWSMIDYEVDASTPAGVVAYLTDVFGTFSKHVQESYLDPALAPYVREVLEIVFGDRAALRRDHPFSYLITPTSPLIIEEHGTDTWLALRGFDMPVAVMPMPLMGATAPGSLISTVLLANCETLGTLCLVEAAEPGVPFIYAPVIATMDPRSGRYASAAVEHYVLSAAGTQMARHYGLPVEASGGGTDHFVPCIQSAYEKAVSILLSSLAWPDILVGPGQLAGATVLSLEQLVIDVELFRMARQAHRGVHTEPEMWLEEALASVGPGGNFLAHPATRANVRAGEWRMSDFGLHGTFDAWRAAGSPSTLDEARARVEEILAAHRPLPLPDDVARELAALRRRAEQAG